MADELECALHFVLIHGGFLGAWVWYRLEDALQNAGCKVSSMDMAGAGIHPDDPDTITTWEHYHKPAIDFFASLPDRAPHEKVVLVGHSFGGFANLMLMEQFPHKIDLAIFVAAFIIPTGVSLQDDTPLLSVMSRVTEKRYLNGTENPATSIYCPQSKLAMFSSLDSEITALAKKLVRPLPARMLATPIMYTKENHGRVPAVYIRYAHDNAILPAMQEYVVTRHGPFQEVVELDGGHFNFLQRPTEFTALLTKLAHQHTPSSHNIQ